MFSWLKCLSSFPTVPSTSQITFSRAISSTSISFEWSNVTGADSYILFVEKLFSSPLEQFNWTFTALSGQIEGLAPSTTYNCYLYSSNSAGRGAKRKTPVFSGEVLQPPSGVSLVSTGKSTARVTWDAMMTWGLVFGANLYRATAVDGTDASLNCTSASTSCQISMLKCGEKYEVRVTAISDDCTSTSNTSALFETSEPTVIADIPVFHDSARFNWTASIGVVFYITVAEDANGARLTCTSNTVNNCNITSLPCGRKYNVTVTYNDGTSLSVPCGPENVTANVSCGTGALTVAWGISVPADNYTTKISRAVGQPLHCNSTDMQCTAEGLVCGSSYVVNVFSITGTCISLPSADVTVQTFPCAPANISTNLLCGTNDLVVNWSSSSVPLNYSVKVVALAGNISSLTCDTKHANCSLSGLQCGQTYNVSVKASSKSCSGPYSQPQTTIFSLFDLLPNLASQGATSYTARVTGPHGFSKTCSSSNLTCFVSDLQCASQYNVTVTAQDGHCTSSTTHTVISTGPCDPANVTSILQCGSNMATVSWDHAAGAVGYTVSARENHTQHLAGEGYLNSCPTTNTSCAFQNLPCGLDLNLTILAQGAESIATANDGHNYTCNSTSSNSCNLTGLPCGENYTITVVTVDGGCWSEPSSAVVLRTGKGTLEAKVFLIFRRIRSHGSLHFSNKSTLLSQLPARLLT
uniref:Fibronectin type-III domain-containing protein n=1 Tax=Takifugu rubripes TaxID=31033 RepID=A0A674NSS5_TAKRU